MSDVHKEELAQALVLWRYVGHGFRQVLIPTAYSEWRRCEALRLAKAVGIGAEYVRELLARPVVSIEIREFE